MTGEMRNQVPAVPDAGDKPVVRSEQAELARKALDPVANAATALPCYSNAVFGPELSFSALVEELEHQSAANSRGNLTRSEATLTAQATSLDAVFNFLLMRARESMHDPDAAGRYLRLALKAQGQCRATLESLAALKNPQTIIAQQANVTSGPQQVNNTLNIKNGPNKLSEATDGERLDARAARADGSADSRMEAVGAVHGTEDSEG